MKVVNTSRILSKPLLHLRLSLYTKLPSLGLNDEFVLGAAMGLLSSQSLVNFPKKYRVRPAKVRTSIRLSYRSIWGNTLISVFNQ